MIISAGTLTGTFTTVNYPDAQDWSIEYDTIGNTVTVGIAVSIPCPADTNNDGTVGIDDFLAVLANWGCGGCPEDIDGDGVVGIDDFLLLLAEWGACP